MKAKCPNTDRVQLDFPFAIYNGDWRLREIGVFVAIVNMSDSADAPWTANISVLEREIWL
jgi:hypothetical protein